MRIVEHEKSTDTLGYALIRGLGWLAAVFALVTTVLLIVNNIELRTTNPIETPALQALLERLKDTPEDMELRQQIQELDALARGAYFSAERFNDIGIILLLGSLVVVVLAFKTTRKISQPAPYPDAGDPREDLVAEAHRSRRTLALAGLVLAGFVFAIALPWESPLDDLATGTAQAATAGGEAAVAPEPPRRPPPGPEALRRNWPAFRGPAAGVALTSAAPLEWGAESGHAWKVPVPKLGYSSPVLWEGQLFITGATQTEREIYCHDAASGELRWTHPVNDVPGAPQDPPRLSDRTGYAASTMATDGHSAFALFANGDLVAVDLEGQRVWSRNLGVPDNPYYHSSSLVIFEDVLLVQYDQADRGALMGLDVASGEARWEAPRTLGASWASPALLEIEGVPQVVLAATSAVISYDPRTGSELWRVDCLEKCEVAITPIYADGLLYVSADFASLYAIDVAGRKVAWENQDQVPGVSTPIVVDGYLIAGLSDGGIACLDAKSGEEVWYEDTDEGFYASPVRVGDRIYLMERSGRMHIFKVGPEFERLAQPALGEPSDATAAFLGESMYLRGEKNLYRIDVTP